MSLLGLGLALRSVLTRLGLALCLSLIALLLLRLRLWTLSTRLGWLLLCSVIGVIITFSMRISGFFPVVFGIGRFGTPFRHLNLFIADFQPFDGDESSTKDGLRFTLFAKVRFGIQATNTQPRKPCGAVILVTLWPLIF